MMKRRLAILLLCILASVVVARAGWWGGEDHDHDHDHDHDEHHSHGQEMVTCGSLIKLRHASTGFRLHSHQVAYGSGSGQQSVTGVASGSPPPQNLPISPSFMKFAIF